jgi:hypothetical protein
VTSNVLFTIGHSTHTLEEFLALLYVHGVRHLVDVRSIPKSRHCPQFNTDMLESSLHAAGIGYTHLKALGGRRHTRKDSINTGWRNTSFRGYADYMATSQFTEGLEALIQIARAETVAIMCAEAVPWRCHRSMIADAMMLKGWEVRDILTTAPRPNTTSRPSSKKSTEFPPTRPRMNRASCSQSQKIASDIAMHLPPAGASHAAHPLPYCSVKCVG